MKRLILLLIILILFSGGTKIQGTKKQNYEVRPEHELINSMDSLQSVTIKLEAVSLKLK